MYNICSTPELPESNFCDGLEIKFTSPLGEKQAKSVALCFTFVYSDYKRLDTNSFVFHYHQLPHGA